MRRFVALMEGLPFDTANVWASERKERRERDGGWTFSDHLAALQVETTHAVFRAVQAPYLKRGTPLPRPLHIPRPGEEVPGPKRVTPLELIQSMRR